MNVYNDLMMFGFGVLSALVVIGFNHWIERRLQRKRRDQKLREWVSRDLGLF